MGLSLFFIADQSIFEVKKRDQGWHLVEREHEYKLFCIAADPTKNGRLYVGTFDDGLFISDDYGETLQQAGNGITHNRVLSVAVSPTETVNGHQVVWAGTEPSSLFRSEDGGETWTDCPTLLDLPSRSTWQFPPRPHTHHVRWIQPDLHDENVIFAGIELGGVMRSLDKGKTWEDRKAGSQYDCHTLTMTPQAKGRLYEAAGGGFAETVDGGKTWRTINDGLGDYTYLVDIAVDPSNPNTIIASAAKSARTAYTPTRAHTVLIRKDGDQAWEMIENGLPKRDGSSVFSLISHNGEQGVFYAVNNIGVFRSEDAARTWSELSVAWPNHLKEKRIRALIVG